MSTTIHLLTNHGSERLPDGKYRYHYDSECLCPTPVYGAPLDTLDHVFDRLIDFSQLNNDGIGRIVIGFDDVEDAISNINGVPKDNPNDGINYPIFNTWQEAMDALMKIKAECDKEGSVDLDIY